MNEEDERIGRSEQKPTVNQSNILEARKPTTFLQDKEDLPTPKKSNSLYADLIGYLNNESQYIHFEKFLTHNKRFDIDYLHFYLRVMEFKKEGNNEKSRLAAGIIIDNYLTEDAENYISVG